MSAERIISRYRNRRLYDFEASRYITLEDVRKLVMDQEDFIIRDHVTKADITCRVLLQVMIEEEDRGEHLLSSDILIRIIRSRSFRARMKREIEFNVLPSR